MAELFQAASRSLVDSRSSVIRFVGLFLRAYGMDIPHRKTGFRVLF